METELPSKQLKLSVFKNLPANSVSRTYLSAASHYSLVNKSSNKSVLKKRGDDSGLLDVTEDSCIVLDEST